jgi:hypothetical protein
LFSTKADIMSLVESLGPNYTLAAVVTLEELGIKQYPLTSAGKVRKNILKELVSKHFIVEDEQQQKPSLLEKAAEPLTPPSSKGSEMFDSVNLEHLTLDDDALEIQETCEKLLEIWATLVVVAPSKDDPIFEFADSITLLRYCDKVWRSLGKKLYLQDFLVHETVEQQAKLLQTRDVAQKDAAGAGMYQHGSPLI